MKIGFDAKRAVQNNTGLGNYSRYLVEVLSEYYPDNEYLLFAPREKENSRLRKLLFCKNVSFIFPAGISKLFCSFWRTFGIKPDLKKHNIKIFHGLSNELPIGMRKTDIKSVVTIHDLIFLRYPEYYKPIDRLIYRYKFKYACQKADKIIAVSECTKRDIISFFHIPAEKISVVYQGCHSSFKETVPLEKKLAVSEKYGLPETFLLYLGSIESRKNLLLIAKALQLVDENIHLVAVGKKTPYQEKVEKYVQENELSARFHIFNDIPFAELPVFYQLSKLFIYPSFFEGFGIPVIEALSCGVPVIAATGSCLEEAGGADSIYVNPDDEKELASKIMQVLDNPELAQKMIASGQTYVKRFSGQSIATDVIKLYKELL